MKINRKLTMEKWFKLDGSVEFLVRRFPFSELKGLNTFGKVVFEQFCYCIVDWKGIVGEDDKPLVCNEEEKLYLFNYYYDSTVVKFMVDCISKLEETGVKEIKNSKK